MKLHNLLLEATARQVFLEFQQRLIELDDGFEQADPAMTDGGSGVATLHFVRPEASKKHNVRFINLVCYSWSPEWVDDRNRQIHDFNVQAFEKAPPGKMVGRKIFRKAVESIDEAMIYLDRIINVKKGTYYPYSG